MPVYEYRCKKCQTQFEVIQKAGGNGNDLICVECGEPQPEKMFSVFSSAGVVNSNSSIFCSSNRGFT